MAAWTIDDYERLCKNIAQGVKVVKYADKQVEYQSLADMLQTKQLMESALGINRNKKVKWAQQSKGLRWNDGRYFNDDPIYNNW